MVYNETVQQRITDYNHFGTNNQETLDLFPLHPTGILQGKTTDQVSSIVSVYADTSTDTNSAFTHEINQEDGCHKNQPFFDFFNNSAGHGS